MTKQIPIILLFLISSIQTSQPNAMQEISTNIDIIYYENQRINITFRDHNTFNTKVRDLKDKDFDTIAQECHEEQKKNYGINLQRKRIFFTTIQTSI